MAKQLSIGDVAKRTGLSTKAIRFYEEEGCIPRAGRSESGYRQYSERDVWRLQLVRQVRLLGMPLTTVRDLVSRSTGAECDAFSDDLIGLLQEQKAAISRRIGELENLREQIDVLTGHIEHCVCEPGQTVDDCDCCSLFQEEGGAQA